MEELKKYQEKVKYYASQIAYKNAYIDKIKDNGGDPVEQEFKLYHMIEKYNIYLSIVKDLEKIEGQINSLKKQIN